ncbi:MAG: sugar-binding protein, partial [Cyanobacteria bacterium J06639_18]
AGAGRFLDNGALNLGIGSPRRIELELARTELQDRGLRLQPELEAGLEFVLGRDVGNTLETCRQHYERSLLLLKEITQEEQTKSDNFKLGTVNENTKDVETSHATSLPRTSEVPHLLEKYACLLYCMGLWWHTYAVIHRKEQKEASKQAEDYFQQCITVFEQAKRSDLAANFINAWGEVLQRQKNWDELEKVANKALNLHQTYPHQCRLARSHGFLAEVALSKSTVKETEVKEAKDQAQQALSILDLAISSTENSSSSKSNSSNIIADLEWERSYHRGWYLFSLAKAQLALDEVQTGIETLEAAKKQTKHQYDPELYIWILAELRNCYFHQSEYLTAFQIKQQQRSLEQQYGFRAFVGAGRLQPKKQVNNPGLALVEQQTKVAQEIAASGRQQDIKRLVERIGQPDHKLTLIHGQSGVGKSSILQAGLIPVLQDKFIGARDVVPVLQQVYTDWVRELENNLAEVLDEFEYQKNDNRVNLILKQLQKNSENQLLTVL